MRPACVLLAAGASKRFGSDKLLYELDGATLLERALRLHSGLPYGERLLVTRKDSDGVIAPAERYGFRVLINGAPERGVGSSAAIAARALMESDAPCALFAVCDQPYLKAESVKMILEAAKRRPDAILAAAHDGTRGNPCLFPRALFSELAELSGERGGSAVIARHADKLTLIETAEASELYDIDVPPEEKA